ncbi:hypothetical protein [Psychrobacillus sp. NPDC096623]|uniref:hypothetical protein n=1 Tax=Psychrobacillus sp. NPDC096623 TaxID=3364492 RepID=UPI00381C6DC3
MRKRKIIFIFCIILVLIIISPPILAPILHNDNTPRSAIRNYIQNAGYPYQSFFALVRAVPNSGNEYSVYFTDANNPKVDDPDDVISYLCYTEKNNEDTFKVSCNPIVYF